MHMKSCRGAQTCLLLLHLLPLLVLPSSSLTNFELLKSEVQYCLTGDLKCTRKLIVELETYQGFDIGAEDAIFVIDSAKDLTSSSGEYAYFTNPFGLRIHKTEALIVYQLNKLEHVTYGRHYEAYGKTQCLNEIKTLDALKVLKHPFSPSKYYDYIYVPNYLPPCDQEGFDLCCTCQNNVGASKEYPTRRVELDCGKEPEICSWHSMREEEPLFRQWTAFEPSFSFDVTVAIDINGELKAKFQLNKDESIGVSRDASIKVTLTSRFFSDEVLPPIDYSKYNQTLPKLYIPCKTKQCLNSTMDRRQWIILEQGQYGTEPNRADFKSSYFKYYFNDYSCYRPLGSLTRHDILSRLAEQDAYEKRYHKLLYSIDRYGKPTTTKQPDPYEYNILYIPHQTRDSSKLKIEFNIDAINFLKRRSIGIIYSVKIMPPRTEGSDTSAVTTIMNLGPTTSDFKITMECDAAIEVSKGNKVTIASQGQGSIELLMILPNGLSFEFTCSVTLLDTEDNQLDQRMIWVSTTAYDYSRKFMVELWRLQHHVGEHSWIGYLYSLVKPIRKIVSMLSNCFAFLKKSNFRP